MNAEVRALRLAGAEMLLYGVKVLKAGVLAYDGLSWYKICKFSGYLQA